MVDNQLNAHHLPLQDLMIAYRRCYKAVEARRIWYNIHHPSATYSSAVRTPPLPRSSNNSTPNKAKMSGEARVDKTTSLESKDAKWIELQSLNWTDTYGKQRVWETATRKTRGSSGIDAVAIAPILLRDPVSTLIIQQFRPPVNAICVEFPAGLIDEGETVETTAVRELKEETGLAGGRVVDVSPTVCSDPGMTTANMQLVTVEVEMGDSDELPEQDLQDSECIDREIVPLKGLYDRLLALSKEGKIVDAKLFHWAYGVQFALEKADKYKLR